MEDSVGGAGSPGYSCENAKKTPGELSVFEQMKIGSQQLKEEMSKRTATSGGFKINIGTMEYNQFDKKEGWAKFLNFLSSKSQHEIFSNQLKKGRKYWSRQENKITVEDLKGNLDLKLPVAKPRLPSIRAKSSIRPSKTGEFIIRYNDDDNIESNGQPKSRLGMMQVNQNSATSKDLTESKDFELFFQKSLLPKELQRVNPMLLGLSPVNQMRALSPVCREVTEEEKDIIHMKYKLNKMNTKLIDDRKKLK